MRLPGGLFLSYLLSSVYVIAGSELFGAFGAEECVLCCVCVLFYRTPWIGCFVGVVVLCVTHDIAS